MYFNFENTTIHYKVNGTEKFLEQAGHMEFIEEKKLISN